MRPDASPIDPPESVGAQGTLIDALAGGDELVGAADVLARRLGMTTAELGAALRPLLAAGWVAAQVGEDARLRLRWERRPRDEPVARDRRRPGDDAALEVPGRRSRVGRAGRGA